jgi:hypothetical protein
VDDLDTVRSHDPLNTFGSVGASGGPPLGLYDPDNGSWNLDYDRRAVHPALELVLEE